MANEKLFKQHTCDTAPDEVCEEVITEVGHAEG